jgi:CRISPR/Cas system CSM-associated protein Csm3 (group 7 of RAMP superfamily)
MFRSRAEMILRTLYNNDICDPVVNPCFAFGNAQPCVICEIFGHHSKKSSVIFSDLEADGSISLKYFTHNKIDRFTGGTIVNSLFDERIVFDGTFKGTIVIDSPDLFTIMLFIQLFKDLYLEDIRIGHGKTKGYGKVKGEITKIKVFASDISKINGKRLVEYGLIFPKKENIFDIIEITDIINTNNKKIFSSLFKDVISVWGYK